MTRTLIIWATAATIAATTVAGTALAGGDRDFGMHRRGHYGGVILLMVICTVGLAALVAWLIVRRRPAVAAGTSMVAPEAPTAKAEAILAERLARSEITPEEYRSTLGALRDAVSPQAR